MPFAVRHSRSLVLALLLVGGGLPWLLYAPFLLVTLTDPQLPFRASPPHEQLAAVGTFFGVKFLYSLFSSSAAVFLFRRKEPDLRAIAWSLTAFFLGEACCFVSVMVYHEQFVPLEHLHSFGMVVSLAFAAYAAIEFVDHRIIHYSGTRHCTMSVLCHGCIKRAGGEPHPCGLRRAFLTLIPILAAAAAIPLFSSFRDYAYTTTILRQPHTYSHPLIHQIYELRYLPVAAVVLLALTFMVLFVWEKFPVPISKILFSAAIGAIGFSFLRLLLVATFIDNQVWFAAWEETTELLYVLLLTVPLVIFHHALFPDPHPVSHA